MLRSWRGLKVATKSGLARADNLFFGYTSIMVIKPHVRSSSGGSVNVVIAMHCIGLAPTVHIVSPIRYAGVGMWVPSNSMKPIQYFCMEIRGPMSVLPYSVI